MRESEGVVKVLLEEKEIPDCWYNIQADMPELPPPPLNSATRQPVSPEDLTAVFPLGLIEQEISQERWIDIPGEVLDVYRLWRPTPLYRARRLEKALKTPAQIYYKYEGVSPAGSHKPNTAVAQAFYNKKAGIKKITTETGAGQWGTALSIACCFFGLECKVYMVRVSYDQKPYRRSFMEAYGAKVIPSPSPYTEAGRRVLEKDPNSLGSLGIAISEAMEEAINNKDTNYSLGSVLNHVLLHQSIIGLEAKAQMEKIGVYPDVVIGCHGGGSNFAGIAFPFLKDRFEGKNVRAVAVEPLACPTLTKGAYLYDYGDTAGFTPLLKMYTLGHDFVPPGIHAGGLRYHGAAPLVSKLYHDGYIEAKAYGQLEVFKSLVFFARNEGILPAPESAHAIHAAIIEAEEAREKGDERVILFNLSGHGHFDLTAYEAYLNNELDNVTYSQAMVAKSLETVPKIEV
ncbi:MAG: Tryptophan synthase beta chain [Thermoanaerobacterales bacterium 50_218]|nr:MAG: Tryptophan synthase beta chain [Thermoanaerobacterales bacterium 50_218]HAA90425.1 TrpB-like pyridoxal phosphate-dependent enzyme [Peptococcaceae bacterium]